MGDEREGAGGGMNLVTFIVPTLARDTLPRALQSIVAQTDPDWNAIVVSDGVDNFFPPVNHPRIFWLNIPSSIKSWRYGGPVRNVGMAFSSGQWFAFLDDDDRLDVNYVKWVREEGSGSDLVVFRMRFPDGGIVPPPDHQKAHQLQHGATGISFAVSTKFQQANSVQFGMDRSEDWYFVETCLKAGARIRVSDKVAYFIRQ